MKGLPPGCQIAVGSVENRYCMIDEVGKAGHILALAHGTNAKLTKGRLSRTHISWGHRDWLSWPARALCQGFGFLQGSPQRAKAPTNANGPEPCPH